MIKDFNNFGPSHHILSFNFHHAVWYKVINLLITAHCSGNVFALGDCSNVPTAKTAAAVAAESHVLKHNLLEVMKGNTPSRKVDLPPLSFLLILLSPVPLFLPLSLPLYFPFPLPFKYLYSMY